MSEQKPAAAERKPTLLKIRFATIKLIALAISEDFRLFIAFSLFNFHDFPLTNRNESSINSNTSNDVRCTSLRSCVCVCFCSEVNVIGIGIHKIYFDQIRIETIEYKRAKTTQRKRDFTLIFVSRIE